MPSGQCPLSNHYILFASVVDAHVFNKIKIILMHTRNEWPPDMFNHTNKGCVWAVGSLAQPVWVVKCIHPTDKIARMPPHLFRSLILLFVLHFSIFIFQFQCRPNQLSYRLCRAFSVFHCSHCSSSAAYGDVPNWHANVIDDAIMICRTTPLAWLGSVPFIDFVSLNCQLENSKLN